MHWMHPPGGLPPPPHLQTGSSLLVFPLHVLLPALHKAANTPPLIGCHLALLEGLTLILAVSASHQSQLASLLAIDAIFVLDLARGLWSSKVGITSLLSWLCSPMLWHHCMLLSVGITQRQSQFLPSPPGNFKQVSFPAYYFIRLVHLR